MYPEVEDCSTVAITTSKLEIDCTIKYAFEEKLDDISVVVTLEPKDIPEQVFQNSRELGTKIVLPNLSAGQLYKITFSPSIGDTKGVPRDLEITTDMYKPIFNDISFPNETSVSGTISIEGTFEQINVTLKDNGFEETRTITPNDAPKWEFASIVPGSQYTLEAKATAGPRVKITEQLLNAEPSIPVLANQIPKETSGVVSSVEMIFTINGFGLEIEKNVTCEEASEFSTLSFNADLLLTFPLSKFGCTLLLRVVSYVTGSFARFVIYLGTLKDLDFQVDKGSFLFCIIFFEICSLLMLKPVSK